MELVGRAALEVELVREGFEVARPNRDLGIDLIAYSADPETAFRAVPIQMKATSDPRFSLNRKYEQFRGLIMAYVWLSDPPRIFLMNYDEALEVLGEQATSTASWSDGGYYTHSSISTERMATLERFEDRWDWLRTRLAEAEIGGPGPKD